MVTLRIFLSPRAGFRPFRKEIGRGRATERKLVSRKPERRVFRARADRPGTVFYFVFVSGERAERYWRGRFSIGYAEKHKTNGAFRGEPSGLEPGERLFFV